MYKQQFSLDNLVELKENEEKEKSKLPYKKYLENLLYLANADNSSIYSSVDTLDCNKDEHYICIKEPIEFIHLFNDCSGQDECIALFQKLLDSKDQRVVSQIIDKDNSYDGLWFNSTREGINLRPGLEDEEWSNPSSVILGDDAVHALVAGRTGSGKSVFLNSVIFSLLAEYSPWELNLFLVDLKKVEFSRYLSKYKVPHINAVAATSEIRYVLSLLNYISNCMIARQNFFALIGQQKISDVRNKYNIVIPRVLLIVDEFQQLFLEATGKEENAITDLLTSITKLGRATGFHLIFASQEMSGTMSQSVFANFKARFALACDADVSSRILGNSAAAKLEKRGMVLANIGANKEDTNRLFKVPYISEEYFYEYLQKITSYADISKYESVHKFYQEDSIKEISELEEILELIKKTRKQYLHTDSGIFDVFTLGESVVFNYKKYDYETVFIERGVRKNIGIFTPVIDDAAYICKLLADNFRYSPIAQKNNHFIFARNDLIMKKLNLFEELDAKQDIFYNSMDFLNEIVKLFNRRKKEYYLLNSYSEYSNLQEFAYEAFCLRAENIISELSEDEKKALKELSTYYKNKSVKDIPEIQETIYKEYDLDNSYFRIINMLYEKEMLKKPIVELFDRDIFWLVGVEMAGKLPREFEEVLTDALNYNMLFIIVACNNDFNDFYMCSKACDYLFVSGNNESYYNKLKLPFTKKSANSIAIDFAISSSATQRSFKKFKYELQQVIVPEIDFDNVLQ